MIISFSIPLIFIFKTVLGTAKTSDAFEEQSLFNKILSAKSLFSLTISTASNGVNFPGWMVNPT